MMSHACEKWQEELSAYIDGELADLEKDALEQHVSSCPDCQSCLQAYQTVQSVLTGWQTEPPAMLRPGILYKTRRSKKNASVMWRRWVSLGSVAAVLLLVTWLVNGDPFQSEEQPMLGAVSEADVAGDANDDGTVRMFSAESAGVEPASAPEATPAPSLESGMGDAVLSKSLETDFTRNEAQSDAGLNQGDTKSDVTLYYIYLSVDLSQEELAALPNAEPQADGSVLVPVEEMEPLLQIWEKESVSNSGKTQIHNAASDKVCLISSQDG